jgi:hypothetical protein
VETGHSGQAASEQTVRLIDVFEDENHEISTYDVCRLVDDKISARGSDHPLA